MLILAAAFSLMSALVSPGGFAQVSAPVAAQENELYVGTAEADISPKLPVALSGQGHLRVTSEARTPMLANIIALDARNGSQTDDAAVFVACDLVAIPEDITRGVREKVRQLLPGFDVNKIVLSATHSHTAPVVHTWSFSYPIPTTGVTQPSDYVAFVIDQVAAGVVKAWNGRQKASVGWGLGQAAIAHNRRAVYADGTAAMYGGTHTPKFRWIEGMEDHDVNVLYFWNNKRKLIGTLVNVPCPAQQAEHFDVVDADYWHEARLALKKRFGQQLCVVGWVGASGDQSPRPMYRSKADKRMHELAGRTRLQELGRRIANAVTETYEVVQKERFSTIPFSHTSDTVWLPMRRVTLQEMEYSRHVSDSLRARINADPKLAETLQIGMHWYGRTADRYTQQQEGKQLEYPCELHVLRIGDVAVCTSPFELFTDYGVQIQGRSKALQTFVVQLAGDGQYLPTERAAAGGGYSAVVQSNYVGPEGGQVLVNETVDKINVLWK